MEVEARFFVNVFEKHAKRQASGQSDLLAIQIGRKMTSVGDDHLAIEAEPDGLAGGKAFGSGEDAVEGLQEFWRGLRSWVRRNAPMRRETFMAAFRPLPATSPMTTEAVIARGLHMKEIAADFVGRAVDGVDFKTGRGDFFLGDQKLLHTAGGGQLVVACSWSRKMCMKRKKRISTMTRIPAKSPTEEM